MTCGARSVAVWPVSVEISQEGAKPLGDVLERSAPEPRCPLLEVGIDIADAQVEDAVGARYMPGQEVSGLPHQGVDCFTASPRSTLSHASYARHIARQAPSPGSIASGSGGQDLCSNRSSA